MENNAETPLCALAVFMKAPVAGRCKTRLTPPLTPPQAATLYRAFCADVLAGVAPVKTDVWIAYETHEAYPTPGWVSGEIPFFPQRGASLGERLVHAFETLFAKGYDHVVALGTDAPSLPPARVKTAFELLRDSDAVFGPAEDGGYYLVGLRRLHRILFERVPWSTDKVLSETRRILQREKISAAFLPEHYDVDSVRELKRLATENDLAALCPRTAAVLAEIQPVLTERAHGQELL